MYNCTWVGVQKQHVHWLLIVGKEDSKHKTADVGWK